MCVPGSFRNSIRKFMTCEAPPPDADTRSVRVCAQANADGMTSQPQQALVLSLVCAIAFARSDLCSLGGDLLGFLFLVYAALNQDLVLGLRCAGGRAAGMASRAGMARKQGDMQAGHRQQGAPKGRGGRKDG